MGYYTDYVGSLYLSRPLTNEEAKEFQNMYTDFEIYGNEMIVTEGFSKNFNFEEDLEKLIVTFFKKNEITVEGELYWNGQSHEDLGYYKFTQGVSKPEVYFGKVVYHKDKL